MITLSGYSITQQIYSGSKTQVYRGICCSNQKPVVIKLYKSEYPTFNELVQFRHQYSIAKNLDLPGVIKYFALEKYGNSFAIIMEDFGGIAISEYIKSASKINNNPILLPDGLNEFLHIAIQITQALEGLYHNRIIHKDIKPQNILINPQTKQVKLFDFSISSLLTRENQEVTNPNVLEGTLAYMSPEQTGRMNRGIDYRTDFYSLGVTFYELLTGQLPFQSDDAMELVHCHIARKPIPPIAINPAIPQILNKMVLKLMAKTAEERYQSALAIKYDLEQCLQLYLTYGNLPDFELATRDITDSFLIPEKLYGRENEVKTLLQAFERVSQGNTEIMLVAGFSGIGKTAVISEVHKPIVRQRGYFIKGKFDQFKRDIPLSAWVQAFQNLIQQLLTENTDFLAAWKEKILAALGESGQVIIDVIPELELLIGNQPPVPELEGNPAQNRFNLLFGKFIRVFATKEHPLVIFLDDLQWADLASLKLMQLLMSESDTRYLLLIGAYRDNEVYAAHPLMLTLDEIRKQSATINQITLLPLDKSSLNCLIADTVSYSLEQAMTLTELVFHKTKGNPFFSNQFLKSLYEEEFIFFDYQTVSWQYDIAKVREQSFSNDVVEFMAVQLQKLPQDTQTVLKLAACIGNHFDLNTLVLVHKKSFTDTASDLWKAVQEGLIIPNNDVYQLFQNAELEDVVKEAELSVNYKFLHDRVQQAAYFLIPEKQKQLTHLKIGRLLLSNTPSAEIEENVFDILNQLSNGLELITEQSERNDLANLNLIAGRKAKASTAYSAAFGYLMAGIKLLTNSSWNHQYNLTLALYESAAEAAYLNGDFEQMEQLTEVVLQHAQTPLDKVKTYDIKMIATDVQGKLKEAIQIGLEALKSLGVELPESPSPLDIQRGLEETQTYLNDKKIQDLINLPLMKDPTKLAAIKILARLVPASFHAKPALFLLLGYQQVKLSILYGNTALSTCGYADYGIILIGIYKDTESGYQFGNMALTLLESFNVKEVKCRTLFKVALFTHHWKHHLKESLFLLEETYSSALETGDIDHVAVALSFKSIYLCFSGLELTDIEAEMNKHKQILIQFKQERWLRYNEMSRQFILNLLGGATNPTRLVGEAFDEDKSLFSFLAANEKLAAFHIYLNKLILCYLFGELNSAVVNAEEMAKYLESVTAMLSIPVFYFYESLAQLGLWVEVDSLNQEMILKKVESNQEQMQKWANICPMNHLHKFYLVEAERCRVLGQNIEAMNYYDRAIAGAKENDYTQEEALANELAAKFYLGWGKAKIAQAYLTDAYYAYAQWGSSAKLEDLEKRYPQLLIPIFKQGKKHNIAESITRISKIRLTSTRTDITETLDLATVIKASQALSEAIRLEQLISNLMMLAIKNTGASKGALILVEKEDLVIEAMAFATDLAEQITPASNSKTPVAPLLKLPSVPINSSEDIPITVINYVSRTFEPLVIADVTTEARFAADTYIIQQEPKSILCTPIIYQTKLIGILYLENNLAKEVFTPESILLYAVR